MEYNSQKNDPSTFSCLEVEWRKTEEKTVKKAVEVRMRKPS
jgi:hypothetical protein